MEQKEPAKPNLPSEAIELYNLFIHGVISRRAFFTEVQKFAIGGLTAATVIEEVNPENAPATKGGQNDDRIQGSYQNIPLPPGDGKNKGHFVPPARPDTRDRQP